MIVRLPPRIVNWDRATHLPARRVVNHDSKRVSAIANPARVLSPITPRVLTIVPRAPGAPSASEAKCGVSCS